MQMNPRSVLAGGLALVLAACGVSPPEEPTSTVVAYEGATLITGDGGPPLGGGVLVVDQGVITDVGLAANVTIPEGATVVDLTGKTVMPTLVDLHGHVGFVDGLSFDSANYTRENIVDQLRRYAYHGVGAIVSMGTDPGELAFEIQADQQAGTLGGARLHTAFRGIARPNAGPGAPTMRPTALGASTAEEARALVAEIANTNAAFVKIWVDDRGGSVDKLTPDLYGPIIQTAHEHDLQVIAHIFYAEDARELVEAGVDGFAHLARDVEMDDALVAAIVEHDVFVMPNLAVSERGRNADPPGWVNDPLLAESVSPEVIGRIRESYVNRTPDAAARGAESFAAMLRSLKNCRMPARRWCWALTPEYRTTFRAIWSTMNWRSLSKPVSRRPGRSRSPPVPRPRCWVSTAGCSRRASAPISWYSMRTRCTTSRTRAGSRRCI